MGFKLKYLSLAILIPICFSSSSYASPIFFTSDYVYGVNAAQNTQWEKYSIGGYSLVFNSWGFGVDMNYNGHIDSNGVGVAPKVIKLKQLNTSTSIYGSLSFDIINTIESANIGAIFSIAKNIDISLGYTASDFVDSRKRKYGISVGVQYQLPQEKELLPSSSSSFEEHLYQTDYIISNHRYKYRVKPKDTLYSISEDMNVTLSDIFKNNPNIEDGIRPNDILELNKIIFRKTSFNK